MTRPDPKGTTHRPYAPPTLVDLGPLQDFTRAFSTPNPDGFGNQAPTS